MKKSTKAVLLSMLVFPGVGHFYLKKYVPGIVLIVGSLAAVSYLMSRTVEKALEISEKIQKGAVPLDVEAITELVSKQSSGIDAQQMKIATLVFIACWLIGIIDSYRVGCIRDRGKDGQVKG